MTGPAAGGRFVGQRVPRHEDARFVTGTGHYVDDIVLPGTLHVAFARSHMARGRLTGVDTSAAAEVPGVIAVLTAADLNHLVREWWTDFEGPNGQSRQFRLFADGDVRFVGEPVAMVVAASRYVAEDAVELVEIDIEPETPVVDPEHAADEGAPLVHPEAGSNVVLELPAVDNPAVESVFASAPHAFTETFRQHRYACVPMETRGILASWDSAVRQLTVWLSTQGQFAAQGLFARVLGLPEAQIRVIMPDVGGAFGQKMFPHPEELAVAFATRRLGQPVKWIEDRRENLLCGEHAREDQATISLAVDDDGAILGAKADFLESVGAFPVAGGSALLLTTSIFPGPYRIGAAAGSGKTVYTNTAGRGSYRGPWMIETVARELMIDHVARALGIERLEIRRRNVIGEADLPYTMATGFVYDQMTAAATLEQAAQLIGYDEFLARQADMRAEGRLIGIGISLLAEPSAVAFGWFSTDAAIVRIGLHGSVDVLTSSASHGQSLETTIAQVVADELGVDVDDVRVIQGDTAVTPFGPGTGGSRSAVVVAGAARGAAQEVRAKVLNIAAHQLEAAVEDLVLEEGRIHVAGTPTRSSTVADVARLAYLDLAALPPDQGPGLEAQYRFAPQDKFTWSNACHMCTCEVDPATGAVTILRYVVSEDCGVMINPSVVEGQIAGGVVQGIGGALYEHMKYDDEGNPLTTTFVDYLLPTAAEVPVIEYGHIETPSPTNPGGHKGMGEGGAIASPPAVVNAVADALAPLGVTIRRQPLSPSEILSLIATPTGLPPG
ncbi:MAG TPA: xanthine dehydrogenase family protein molybdopterin-binding subunit [Acidimicrobiales bacterium]